MGLWLRLYEAVRSQNSNLPSLYLFLIPSISSNTNTPCLVATLVSSGWARAVMPGCFMSHSPEGNIIPTVDYSHNHLAIQLTNLLHYREEKCQMMQEKP